VGILPCNLFHGANREFGHWTIETCHVSRCHPTSHVKPTWLSKSIICKKNLLSNMPIFWISYQNWEQQQYKQSSTFALNDTARNQYLCSVFVCCCTWSGVQKNMPISKSSNGRVSARNSSCPIWAAPWLSGTFDWHSLKLPDVARITSSRCCGFCPNALSNGTES